MTSIGIVGAGVSALHLGLLLRRNDVGATIYTERSADEVARGRLVNTVAHHHPTLERERLLGIGHWDIAQHGYGGHQHYIGGPVPLAFRGEFSAPSRAIDYRIYLPQLMDDFEEQGGEIRLGPVGPAELQGLSERHDLMVVAAGRGALADLFTPRPERTYAGPARRLTGVLLRGVAPAQPADVTLSVSPGEGEIIEIPFLTFGATVTVVLFEGVPGGALAALADLRYTEDPRGFDEALLAALKVHAPLTFERVDGADFGVTRPEDVLQGALTPCLREDYARLPNGSFALAVGDVHCLMDPVVAQGANAASYSAWVTGQAILEDRGFGEDLCRRVASRRAEFIESAFDWVDAMLAPPTPQLLAMILAMAVDKGVADEFTDNFAYPVRQWAALSSMENTRAHLARHGHDADALLAAATGNGGRHRSG